MFFRTAGLGLERPGGFTVTGPTLGRCGRPPAEAAIAGHVPAIASRNGNLYMSLATRKAVCLLATAGDIRLSLSESLGMVPCAVGGLVSLPCRVLKCYALKQSCEKSRYRQACEMVSFAIITYNQYLPLPFSCEKARGASSHW